MHSSNLEEKTTYTSLYCFKQDRLVGRAQITASQDRFLARPLNLRGDVCMELFFGLSIANSDAIDLVITYFPFRTDTSAQLTSLMWLNYCGIFDSCLCIVNIGLVGYKGIIVFFCIGMSSILAKGIIKNMCIHMYRVALVLGTCVIMLLYTSPVNLAYHHHICV